MTAIHRRYGRYGVDYLENTRIEKERPVVEAIRHQVIDIPRSGNGFVRLAVPNQRAYANADGVSVITDFKGPGKTRAVYELLLDGPSG